MTSLPPLFPGGTPPQPAIPPGVLVVVDAPAEVDALPLGARIAGVVMSGGSGAIAIRTGVGTLIVESPVPLQKGAAVSLMVQTVAPGMVLRITQIAPAQREATFIAATRGQNKAGMPSPADRNAPGMPAAAVQTAGTAAASGGRIEAIVLRPLSGGTFGGAAGPGDAGAESDGRSPLSEGTRLSLRIVPSAPTHSPTGAPAGAPSSSATQFGPGQTLTARFVRSDGAGRPLLVSSAGPLVLSSPVNLPPQWSGELEIVAVLPQAPADVLAAREQIGSIQLLTDWRTLEHVLGVLSETDPAAARHVREAVLPQPTSSLAANFLKFLGLLRQGDVRGWIGDDAYRALANSQPDLLERLGADLRKQTPHAGGAGSGDWRILTVPMVVDGALAPVTMLIRNRPQPDKAGGANDGDSTRFVLDLALSRLGRMQIDGLLQAHGKQLDLIVRTEHPLAVDVQSGIRHIAAEAAAVSALRATVCFRAAPAHFLDTVALSNANAHLRSSLVI